MIILTMCTIKEDRSSLRRRAGSRDAARSGTGARLFDGWFSCSHVRKWIWKAWRVAKFRVTPFLCDWKRTEDEMRAGRLWSVARRLCEVGWNEMRSKKDERDSAKFLSLYRIDTINLVLRPASEKNVFSWGLCRQQSCKNDSVSYSWKFYRFTLQVLKST